MFGCGSGSLVKTELLFLFEKGLVIGQPKNNPLGGKDKIATKQRLQRLKEIVAIELQKINKK
jgi:hypothetical protein